MSCLQYSSSHSGLRRSHQSKKPSLDGWVLLGTCSFGYILRVGKAIGIASRWLISLLRNWFCPITWGFGSWKGYLWCKAAPTQGHQLALFSWAGLLTLSGGTPSFPEVLSLSVTGTTKLLRLSSLLSDRAAFSPWGTTCLIHTQEVEELYPAPCQKGYFFLENTSSFSQFTFINFHRKDYTFSPETFRSVKISSFFFPELKCLTCRPSILEKPVWQKAVPISVPIVPRNWIRLFLYDVPVNHVYFF